MEIDGEVNIEIDQYSPVNFEIDVGTLAEELCQSYNLVDDVVLREYVREQMENELDDRVTEAVHQETQELRVNVAHAQAEFEGELQDLSGQVDDLDNNVDELREQIRELSPDNNYVRINDLHATIREVVDASFVTLLTKLTNYMESTYFREQRNANQ